MMSTSLTPRKMVSESSAQHWKPHAYQKKAIKFLLEHAAAGLFLDPGLGKTSICLAAIKILKKEGMLNRVLIVAPLRVCYQVWPKEQQKWEDFTGLKVRVLHDKTRAAWTLDSDADIIVTNHDTLPWLLQKDNWTKLQADTLIVDESTKFKHTNTKRFKALKPLLPTFKRRWILTGSPNPNGYLDLFGQLYLLDLGRSLGLYITNYRFNFFYPTGYGGYTWKLKPEADKAIQDRIKPLVLRLDAEDYLAMPAVIENVIRVELPDSVRKVYDDLEEEMLATLDGGEIVTALNAAAASVKCAQVANGGLYHQKGLEDWNEVVEGERTRSNESYDSQMRRFSGAGRQWTNLHTTKVEAVMELVEELNGAPLLVAYDFQHDLDRLTEALGKDVAVLGGGTSMKATDAVVQKWNAGDIPVLLAHPQAMGHGLNLQDSGCQHIAWHSITWDYELYDQFIRRVRRQGHKADKIFVHHIVAKDTVDEAKLRSLKAKAKGQKGLLDALRSYLKGRKS